MNKLRTGDTQTAHRRTSGRPAGGRIVHTPSNTHPAGDGHRFGFTHTHTPNIALTDPPLHTTFVDCSANSAIRFHTDSTPPIIIGTELNKEFIEFTNLSRVHFLILVIEWRDRPRPCGNGNFVCIRLNSLKFLQIPSNFKWVVGWAGTKRKLLSASQCEVHIRPNFSFRKNCSSTFSTSQDGRELAFNALSLEMIRNYEIMVLDQTVLLPRKRLASWF